jgi:tRNA pseudouridine55 synthase
MEKTDNKKAGLLLLNKPRGWTSHDVVDFVRGRFKMKRVGHAGTLDPQATGLLIVFVGRYTKFFPRFANLDKEYVGVMKLGEVTTTGDAEGKVIKKIFCGDLDKAMIEEVFASFKGDMEQIPPMVSAVRVGGRRLYQLARRGIEVERRSRKIKIYDLKLVNINSPFITFYVKCSKGTYIRKLAEDIGEKLGCGAHIIHIVRTSVGNFKLQEATDLEDLTEYNLRNDFS